MGRCGIHARADCFRVRRHRRDEVRGQRPGRLWIAAIVLASLAALRASPARADDLSVVLGVPHFAGDSLAVDWRITSLLDDGARRSLESGIGAEIVITLEVWKVRRFWFNKLEASRVLEYLALLDERNRRFELNERAGPNRAFATVADLESFIASPAAVAIAASADLSLTARYFVSIDVELKPLTIEAMHRIEHWMGGTAHSEHDHEDAGGLTRGLIGIAADLSGFGDRVGSDRTETFRITEIGRGEAGESDRSAQSDQSARRRSANRAASIAQPAPETSARNGITGTR
jgi:hypothetical protein